MALQAPVCVFVFLLFFFFFRWRWRRGLACCCFVFPTFCLDGRNYRKLLSALALTVTPLPLPERKVTSGVPAGSDVPNPPTTTTTTPDVITRFAMGDGDAAWPNYRSKTNIDGLLLY